MRVLGIDASLRSTGLGVVESGGNRLRVVEFGVIKNAPSLSHSLCLKRLHEEIGSLIERTRPDAAAIEAGFYFKNAKTALVLGEVRGVAIAVCASLAVPIYEYTPRHAKLAITGYGGASKEQVARMLRTLLGLGELPPEDAADALSLAVCHLLETNRASTFSQHPL